MDSFDHAKDNLLCLLGDRVPWKYLTTLGILNTPELKTITCLSREEKDEVWGSEYHSACSAEYESGWSKTANRKMLEHGPPLHSTNVKEPDSVLHGWTVSSPRARWGGLE